MDRLVNRRIEFFCEPRAGLKDVAYDTPRSAVMKGSEPDETDSELTCSPSPMGALGVPLGIPSSIHKAGRTIKNGGEAEFFAPPRRRNR